MTHFYGGKGMQIFPSGANPKRKRRETAEVTKCKSICHISYQIANILIFADLYFLNGINIG